VRAIRLTLCSIATVAVAVVPAFGQAPAGGGPQPPSPPEQRPHNPTQEVAGQKPEGPALDVGPAKLRVGGYLGLTGIFRSTNIGGDTGTPFATIPYDDQLQAHVSETRLAAESSRISLRVDAEFTDAATRFDALSGYLEVDFGGTDPGNVAVTATSSGLRIRHAFAEARYGEKVFLSAGQAFSLMTPLKDRISMWPADVEMSQSVDTNYLAGMIWGRYPQLRVTWRPSTSFSWAASVENPEQQIGNGLVTLPSCCASDISAQYNTGGNGLSVPNMMPDLVTRVALRPVKAVHLDAGGVMRVFRHTLAPYDDNTRHAGGGISVNGSVNVTPKSRLIVQSAFGPGLGRYVGGLAPDVAFHADGTIDPIRTSSWVTGFEQQLSSRASAAAYYSGLAIDQAIDRDADGTDIGFGFPGSPRSNNRRIQEVTGTFSALTVKTDRRGSAQFGLQGSWLRREAWSTASGAHSASAWLFFAQIRYNLP